MIRDKPSIYESSSTFRLVRAHRGIPSRHAVRRSREHPMTARDLGLLALRVGVGGTLVAHGAQKLFGWFGGAGLQQTGKMFEQLGFRPGQANAIAAGLGEAGGGALLAGGGRTPRAR